MQKQWYRLDTAALIFPAVAKRDWCNAFRLSVTLNEPVDPEVLQKAVEKLAKRFPSFFVTLRKGFFWYYLEESRHPVTVREDYAYPLTFMRRRELQKNCLRVLYYKNRIALEFFHALTDGRGGSVLLCNLTACYLSLRYGLRLPVSGELVDLAEAPRAEELEDSFLKYTAEAALGGSETRAYRLRGTREEDGFRHLTTGIVDTGALVGLARSYGVSVTALLGGVMARSVIALQNQEVPRRRQRPVRITIPVDLRRLYGSRTLRNFALVLNTGVDPRFGDYSTEQLCKTIWHQLCACATPQYMAGMIAANVLPQRVAALRLAPVGVKNLVMKLVYLQRGEGGGCLNISNLGSMSLPEEMRTYVRRMEFIIGPQRSYPNNCSVVSYGGKTYINMIRSIREKELERRFFSELVAMGIPVEIETNRRDRALHIGGETQCTV